jgi:hypothetical protein
VGAALLAVATASSALVALSGALIAMCWVGVVAYAVLGARGARRARTAAPVKGATAEGAAEPRFAA